MKNRGMLFVFCSLLMSCQSGKKSKEIKIVDELPESFEMYKTSEMAELMRMMLAKNKELRQKIINEEDIGDFNEAYLKIHTAKLTDSSDFDASYPTFSKYFIKTQKEIFLAQKEKQVERFNNSVDACIACHKDRCTGPIPRIEKLRIK